MKTLTREYLSETPMLDFENKTIQMLIENKKWRKLSQYDAIGAIYKFVRDDILFGYNSDDRIPASRVLKDGYGQCNTKGTLLMALLRAVGIPTRIHGFTIFKDLQKGAIPSYLFYIVPERIIHSWVEVYSNDRWINLEGYIIDRPYLNKVQEGFRNQCSEFKGYGIATKCLQNPPIDWEDKDTFIQKEGIADDFGVYTQPDDFYLLYGSNLTGIKKLLFRFVIRHLININVKRIRAKGLGKCNTLELS
ncbi:transglutaminase family protein [Microbulbifer sp. EKSA008]|uniref:transglutaminase-like domain-containing protein n=1 Tax=unclassified Microbulbifer TaxID=2619833 RepID=UPI001267E250|nr:MULTISPECIES: transglutaminase family protein [unclassified Microbulbifer]QFT55940.1 Transglutaminase-like superfamily protein [Microbulbifer sp. THAF38]WHI48249.1 transglutaminase family protein [Microbulbifer sp. VAAF005]